MARLYTCGFENQGTYTTGENNKEWSYVVDGSALSISTSIKRSGAASLRVHQVSNEMNMYQTLGTPTEIYFRFYLYIVSLPASAIEITRVYTSSSIYAHRLILNSDGSLDLQGRVGTSLVKIGSSSPVLALNTWHCVEGYVKVNATTWNYGARLNYTQFASGSDSSQASTTVLRFYLTTDVVDCDFYVDDFAINDSTGTYQNSWPGNGRVVYLRPNEAGDVNDCLSGDYSSINEVISDDATSYAVFDNDNDILDVHINSPSSNGIANSDKISVVTVISRASTKTAANAQYNLRLKSQSSGTVLSSSNIILNTTAYWNNPQTYGIISYVDTQAGGVWTPALLETAQIGIQVTDASPNIWLTQLYLIVEYSGIKTINSLGIESIKSINSMVSNSLKYKNELSI